MYGNESIEFEANAYSATFFTDTIEGVISWREKAREPASLKAASRPQSISQRPERI